MTSSDPRGNPREPHPEPAPQQYGQPLPGATQPLFSQPRHHQPTPQAVQPVNGVWHESVRPGPTAGTVLNVLFLSVAAVVTVGVVLFFAVRMGSTVFVLCGLLAMIPLGICLLALRWIDRWEPEPRLALLGAFLWGAGASVVVALLVGGAITKALIGTMAASDPQLVSAVLQAPMVEETAKGLGVLLLFFLRRRTFDGPIDGVVYAGMVAAGFAFTENIIYFYAAVAEAGRIGPELIQIFILRGLLSPFAHVMFTGTMGAILGLAARYGNTLAAVLAWAAGLIPAMALHALWNSSTLISQSFLGVYIVLQVPLFLLAVLAIVLMRRAEARLTFQRLGEYVPSGWFTPQEVTMLATGPGRRRAVAWARSFQAADAMKTFVQAATRLAFTRQRIVVGAEVSRNQEAERQLLRDVTDARNQLFARLHAAQRRY